MPQLTLDTYIFSLHFNFHVPDQLDNMAEHLLTSIGGVMEAYIHHDWAEIKVEAEYVREQGSEEEYFAKLDALCKEVVETTKTARLLLDKIDTETAP